MYIVEVLKIYIIYYLNWKYYEKVLIKESTNILSWLDQLKKTKRGKNAFVFSNIRADMISFTWKHDATTFALKFGAIAVTREEILEYRKYKSI